MLFWKEVYSMHDNTQHGRLDMEGMKKFKSYNHSDITLKCTDKDVGI